MPDRFKDTDFNGGVNEGGVSIVDGDVLAAGDTFTEGLNRNWTASIFPGGGSMWLPSSGAAGALALNNAAGAGSQYGHYYPFADDSLRGIMGKCILPAGYDGRPFNVRLFWSGNTAETGDAEWRIRVWPYTPNGGRISGGDAADLIVASTFAGTDNITIASGTTSAVSNFPANARYGQVSVQRRPTETPDTLSATARFIGLELSMT
jgi:hypothetical protein